MEKKLIREFNKDLHYASIICIFEEFDLWKQLGDGLYEEGPFGDIEVDIVDFLESHPSSNNFDIISRTFESINLLDSLLLTYEISFGIDLPRAMVEVNWVDEETPEEKFIDIPGIAFLSATYKNWNLVEITCYITSALSREDKQYELWPNNELPKEFDGEFGVIEEFISNFQWKHLQTLLEVKLSTLTRQFDTPKWNNIQKDLWIKTCRKSKTDLNNSKKFIKFGEFFYNYVNKHGETPSVNQIIRGINVGK